MANVVQQRRRSPWQFRSNYSAAFLLSAATVLVLVSRVDAVRPPSLEADVDASGQLHAARDAGESASKKPRGSSLASASSQQTSSLKDKLDDNQKDNKPARVGADLVDENQKEKAEAESTSKKAGASDEKNGNDKPVDKEKSSKQNAAANKDPKSVKAAPQEKVKVDAKDGLQLQKEEVQKGKNEEKNIDSATDEKDRYIYLPFQDQNKNIGEKGFASIYHPGQDILVKKDDGYLVQSKVISRKSKSFTDFGVHVANTGDMVHGTAEESSDGIMWLKIKASKDWKPVEEESKQAASEEKGKEETKVATTDDQKLTSQAADVGDVHMHISMFGLSCRRSDSSVIGILVSTAIMIALHSALRLDTD